MSSIFNLLSGLESDGGQIKPMARSKTSHEIRLNSLKTMEGAKPKGLSIRSNSDMNISVKKNTHGKEQECSKLKVTQIDSCGRPISPGKQTPVKKSIAHSSKLKAKESALKKDAITNKCIKKQLNDDIFKKPLLPQKNLKKFPIPEKLSSRCDPQDDFDYGYIETVEKEFKNLLSKGKENIKPCKNNVPLSDSESLLLLDTPIPSFDKIFNEELSSLDLLEVSDMSDMSDVENL